LHFYDPLTYPSSIEGFVLRDKPAVGESRYEGVEATRTINNPFRATFEGENLGAFPSEGESALAFLHEYLNFHAKHTFTPEPYSGFFLRPHPSDTTPPPPPSVMVSQVGNVWRAEIELLFGVVSIIFRKVRVCVVRHKARKCQIF
jgi:hypothetical protein